MIDYGTDLSRAYASGYRDGVKDFVGAFRIKFVKEKYRDNYVIDDEMLDNLVKEMVGK